MVHVIENYKYGYRMAIIDKEQRSVFDDEFEHLSVEDDEIRFSSDNVSIKIDKDNLSVFSELHTGDVISINEKGIYNILYNQEQGETVFYMGGNCNSNCLMCPAGDAERKKDYSRQWLDTLGFIKMLPAQICYYVITGGEPTLNKDGFLTVADYIKNKFIETGGIILTNGRSFASGQFADEFKERAPKDIMLAIPIHGASEKTHDVITQARGSFKQTMKGIRNLIDREFYIEIRIVVTKLNCNETLGIAKLIADYFPDVFRVNFIGLEVRGSCFKNRKEVYITPKDSFDKSKSAIDYLLSKGINVGLYNYPLCNVDREYWLLCKKSIAYEKSVYDSGCDYCDMKEECGGLFNSTLKAVAPPINPIRYSRRTENTDEKPF